MANVRIDNLSNDKITVLFDGAEYVIGDDENVTIQNVGKTTHILTIHRTRVPIETSDKHEEKTGDKMVDFSAGIAKDEESIHVQLDAQYHIEMMSSKAVISIQQYVTAVEKISTDALFSGYQITLTGAKSVSDRQFFANSKVRKRFISNQLKNAFIPVGIGGVLFLILGIVAVSACLSGDPLTLADREFTMPWSLGVLAVGVGCFGYVGFTTARTMKLAKKYKIK